MSELVLLIDKCKNILSKGRAYVRLTRLVYSFLPFEQDLYSFHILFLYGVQECILKVAEIMLAVRHAFKRVVPAGKILSAVYIVRYHFYSILPRYS